MGLFDAAKGVLVGKRAYSTHVDANKLANEGKPAEAKQKYQAALKLYDEAARLGPLPSNTLLSYAMLLMREGQPDKARDLLKEMSRRKDLTKDDWFELRVEYSVYLWSTGQLDSAFETMGRAADYKMNGNVYGTLGMYWVDRARQTGDFKGALAFNEQALDYDDEDAATLDNLGQLYEAMAAADPERAAEYRAKALDFFKKAHESKPRQITTLYYLARMYHQNGDDASARKLLADRDTLYFSAINPVTREMMDALAKEIG